MVVEVGGHLYNEFGKNIIAKFGSSGYYFGGHLFNFGAGSSGRTTFYNEFGGHLTSNIIALPPSGYCFGEHFGLYIIT